MRIAGALALLATIAAAPAQAGVCLGPETLAAARVHQFSTMMLTVALRCRAIAVDLSPSYEAMLRIHAPEFNASVRQLKSRFAGHDFDNYTTRLGNRYGGGATDPANCHRFEKVSNDLAATPELSALARVAFAMVPEPYVEGIACDPH